MHRRAVLRALEEASDAGEIPDATLADLEAITAGVDPDAAASETDGDGLDGAMAGQDGHGGGPSPDGDQEEHDDRSGPGARDGQKGRDGRGGHVPGTARRAGTVSVTTVVRCSRCLPRTRGPRQAAASRCGTLHKPMALCNGHALDLVA